MDRFKNMYIVSGCRNSLCKFNFGQNYVTKRGAIGNIQGNMVKMLLGTHGNTLKTFWGTHWQHGGNTNIQKN